MSCLTAQRFFGFALLFLLVCTVTGCAASNPILGVLDDLGINGSALAESPSHAYPTTPDYTGEDAEEIVAAIKQALVGPVTQEIETIADVHILSPAWHEGFFTDTGVRYRKITAAVLWHNEGESDTCQFSSYNFLQTRTATGWSTLQFRSFCGGCLEGQHTCPDP